MEAQICKTCKNRHNHRCFCQPNSVCEKYEEIDMVTPKTWDEFRNSGLLWWINMILHTFGWAIAIEIADNGEIAKAYPARVRFRGFSEKCNTDGYIQVSQYLKENAKYLLDEANDD